MPFFLKTATTAAQKAGKYLVSQLGSVEITEKNPGDFVTQADFESQRLIAQWIDSQCPGHDFLGEEDEQGHDGRQNSDYTWIVDPIDGTTNFIHQLRSFSVSIALRYKNQMLVGCVHDPLLDETYTAMLGQGAHLNGEPISASRAKQLSGSIAVCSLPRNLNRQSWELKQLVNVLCDSDITVRRLGSAALNLSYIAAGRVDSYWSTFAKIWDIAAGALILKEAGGMITDINGGELDWDKPQFIACGTTELNSAMIEILRTEE